MVLSPFITIFLLGFKLTSYDLQKILVWCRSHDLWFATSCKDHAHAIGRCKTITVYIQGLDIALHRHSKILVLTMWWYFPDLSRAIGNAMNFGFCRNILTTKNLSPKASNQEQTQTNRSTNKPQHWRLHLQSPPHFVSLLFSSTQWSRSTAKSSVSNAIFDKHGRTQRQVLIAFCNLM